MELLPDLIAIGFTEYEAKVYAALLREYPATGYQISKQAGIPRSMVYEALGRLHTRGAVLKTDDRRSTLYRPVPPDILLDRFDQEHQNLIQNLRDRLRPLYKDQNGDRMWSVQGQGAVHSYVARMITAAQTELMFVLPDSQLQILRAGIRAASERGVEVSALLTGEGNLDCGQIARHPPLESELQELTDMLVVVADDNECLIANTDLDVSATVTTNPNLVLITRQFIWMELFAQRIYNRFGPDLLDRLDPDDRRIFESFSTVRS
ncbi:MAG: helix-turn-helix domain-containing protein [Anaerolineales bacterium]|jgi:sugar-specific transcriptional regulator TrmB